MSDVTTVNREDADAWAFVPTGRPVMRFVLAIAALGLALTAIWISGLFAAQVSLTVDEGFGDPSARAGTAVVSIHNLAALEARVDQVDVASEFVRATRPAPARVVRVAGRDTARIAVPYVVDCAGFFDARPRGALPPSVILRVHVKGALGGGRWLRAAETSPSEFCAFADLANPRQP